MPRTVNYAGRLSRFPVWLLREMVLYAIASRAEDYDLKGTLIMYHAQSCLGTLSKPILDENFPADQVKELI